jgi:ABC-type transporter Mla maintaining outer membrane lipid asymmetry ATPase subunit MlaF
VQSATPPAEVVIELRKVSTRFGEHVVHTEVDLQVRRAEVFALIGGSGSGKSTLLREMILLQRPNAGRSGCSAWTCRTSPTIRRWRCAGAGG